METLQSKAACQKVADETISRLLKEPFDPEKDTHIIDISSKQIGNCQYADFWPIMQDACRSVFGERCDTFSMDRWRVGFKYDDPKE
jgi:hypothetical protein